MHFSSPPTMMKNESDNIRVAITSDSILHRNHLQKTMEHSGIDVVLNESLTEKFMSKLDFVKSDAVIFDVESIEDEHIEYLDQLLEQTEIPIIINDVSALILNEPKTTSKWNSALLKKIADLTGRTEWDDIPKEVSNDSSQLNVLDQTLAKNVWVLGASLGGPEMLKRFLIGIPEDLPVAFIVAQHLGENFVALLAEQLDRYTEFKVFVPKEGHVIRHGEALIAPTDKRLIVNPIGAVEYKDIVGEISYTPSIDFTIQSVASRYKGKSGAIIFSGMCDDGVEGCAALVKKGGQVWVQDTKSCVISAMPESVANNVNVDFRGNPMKLAEQLVSLYQNKHKL
ncbi:MAG: chemotaxis protein CheB [Woeseiaceae bacterium]